MSHLHTFILFSRIHRFIYILYTFDGGDICFTGFSNITLKEYVYLRPWYTLLSHDDSIGFATATPGLLKVEVRSCGIKRVESLWDM